MTIIFPLFVAIALTGLTPAGAAAEAAKPGRAQIAVSTAPVATTTWPDSIEAQGAVAAWQEAAVSARAGGAALAGLHADVGDRVRRGALLASFDDRQARAELDKADAGLAQARASRKQAGREHERALALKGTGAISEQEALQAETHAESAQAQLQAAEAALQAARIRLEDTRVLAPDDGLITHRSAVLGQVPAPGAELYRMIRRERLEWRAELTYAQLQRVKPGMEVSLSMPDGSVVRGKIRKLAGALETANRMGLAYADLQAGSAARAGVFAGGRIEVAQTPALVVPAASVVIRDGRAQVFRVAQAKAQRVAVTTGRRRGELIELLQGVRPGEMIAVQGAAFLSDGDTVRTVAADKSTPAARQP